MVSIGNVRFPVALGTGGVRCAGVIAFFYSDLLTIPVHSVYRKYCGWRVVLYAFVVFFVPMAFSGFLMEQLLVALDIVPSVVEEESADPAPDEGEASDAAVIAASSS